MCSYTYMLSKELQMIYTLTSWEASFNFPCQFSLWTFWKCIVTHREKPSPKSSLKRDVVQELPPILLQVVSKGKGKFLYSAVYGLRDCSKRFTLYFPGRPVQSNTVSTSLGSIQTYATVNARRLLVTYPPLSITRCCPGAPIDPAPGSAT